MIRNKAYKFRVYPNDEQKIMFARTFGCCRKVWNLMLADKIAHYQEYGKMLHNTPAQYKKDYPYLKEVDSLSLANVQMHIQAAFRAFFKQPKTGYPKFKSKHKTRASYTTNVVGNNIRIEGRYIRLPKVGLVKIRQHREMCGTLKSVTVSMSKAGKYYISCLCEYEVDIEPIESESAIGLDYSSPNFYIDSNGNEPDYPRFYRLAEVKLAREQRKLSHKQHGSRNYEKQRIRVARIHEHIANQRRDFLHKLSAQIANEYDVVGIESLDMKAMAQSLSLGKSTNDNGWGMFMRFLEYKLEDRGKQLICVDKWFPSTKTCSECGHVKPIKLNERTYVCPVCGMVMDRDHNAAKNILSKTLDILSRKATT